MGRWLFSELVRRELRQRYAGSASGVAWTFLQPLAQLALFAFVFSQIFRATVPPQYAGVSYTAFVAVALWPWLMFSEALRRALEAVVANAGVIRKVALPSEVFVYSSVAACSIAHLAGYLAVLLVLAATGERIHLLAIPMSLVLWAAYAVLALSIGLVLAALQTFLKDVGHVTDIALNVLFYATPILYPLSFVPDRWREFLEANPLAYLSERMREMLLSSPSMRLMDVAALAGCAVAMLAGQWVFRRLAPYFEDFL